ncbi:TPR repeat protein [Aspergillus oryzae 100-8]|uniref:TPR repeat protein n=1 Tax=Aspergillus oryzae (strain 3.042) TaxID=1160506 RepID=I7ZQR2_ASPO3|nr:TPR repeat protein [Aspergillus oryzae 3.042]KDE77819.1 TPR repeat protein [Aspergillus oryzae 100-8]|eukprot:EIT74339.1 TPR repeat protein [Aspergillus oryzae 3.042]
MGCCCSRSKSSSSPSPTSPPNEMEDVRPTLQSLIAESDALLEENRWVEARGKLDQAVQLSEQQQGPDHEDTLETKAILAYNLRKHGEYQEAFHLEEQDSRATQTSMNNLANSYHQQCRFGDAARLHEKTLELRVKTLGRDHFETIMAMDLLGVDCRELGQVEKAARYQEEALELATNSLGEASETTLRCSINLASTYQAFGTADGQQKALTLLERALDLSRRNLGEESPETVGTMNNLAVAYVKADRLDDAYPLLKAAYDINRKTLGPDHPKTRASEGNYNYVMEKLGLTQANIFGA